MREKMKLWRKFGGRRYRYHGRTHDKREANRWAEDLRKFGYPTRVVESEGWYVVYSMTTKRKKR